MVTSSLSDINSVALRLPYVGIIQIRFMGRRSTFLSACPDIASSSSPLFNCSSIVILFRRKHKYFFNKDFISHPWVTVHPSLFLHLTKQVPKFDAPHWRQSSLHLSLRYKPSHPLIPPSSHPSALPLPPRPASHKESSGFPR